MGGRGKGRRVVGACGSVLRHGFASVVMLWARSHCSSGAAEGPLNVLNTVDEQGSACC